MNTLNVVTNTKRPWFTQLVVYSHIVIHKCHQRHFSFEITITI